jgi:hypothetical protein
VLIARVLQADIRDLLYGPSNPSEEALQLMYEITLIQTDLTKSIEHYLTLITKLRVLLERGDVDLQQFGFSEGDVAEFIEEVSRDSDDVKTFKHALTLIYRVPEAGQAHSA